MKYNGKTAAHIAKIVNAHENANIIIGRNEHNTTVIITARIHTSIFDLYILIIFPLYCQIVKRFSLLFNIETNRLFQQFCIYLFRFFYK